MNRRVLLTLKSSTFFTEFWSGSLKMCETVLENYHSVVPSRRYRFSETTQETKCLLCSERGVRDSEGYIYNNNNKF